MQEKIGGGVGGGRWEEKGRGKRWEKEVHGGPAQGKRWTSTSPAEEKQRHGHARLAAAIEAAERY